MYIFVVSEDLGLMNQNRRKQNLIFERLLAILPATRKFLYSRDFDFKIFGIFLIFVVYEPIHGYFARYEPDKMIPFGTKLSNLWWDHKQESANDERKC